VACCCLDAYRMGSGSVAFRAPNPRTPRQVVRGASFALLWRDVFLAFRWIGGGPRARDQGGDDPGSAGHWAGRRAAAPLRQIDRGGSRVRPAYALAFLPGRGTGSGSVGITGKTSWLFPGVLGVHFLLRFAVQFVSLIGAMCGTVLTDRNLTAETFKVDNSEHAPAPI